MADKQLLTQPFDPVTIRQRPGSGRNVFDYVPGGDVIARVIQATDNTFGWTVDHVELIQQSSAAYWLVRGTLTIPELGSRQGLGTHPADSVDSVKAAETDAFKRAAVKFGVALHLYTDDPAVNGKDAVAPVQPRPEPVTRKPVQRSAAPQPMRYERDEYSQLPPEPVRHPVAVRNAGNGSCPECHAPAGRPHATRCRFRDGR